MQSDKSYSNTQTWETVCALIEQDSDNQDSDNQELIIPQAGYKAVVAFVGDPYTYDAVWNESKNGWSVRNEHNILHQDVVPILRILINVIVISENNIFSNNRAAFFDMGVHTFRILHRARDEYGLDKWLYEIERLDDDCVQPHYTILPNLKIDDHLAVRLACVPQIALASLINIHHPERDPGNEHQF